MRRFPWGVFVLVAIVLNVVRQLLFPPSDVGSWETVGLFFVVLAISYAVVGLLRAMGMGKTRRE